MAEAINQLPALLLPLLSAVLVLLLPHHSLALVSICGEKVQFTKPAENYSAVFLC